MSKKSQNKNFEFCASKHVLFLYQLTIKFEYNKSADHKVLVQQKRFFQHLLRENGLDFCSNDIWQFTTFKLCSTYRFNH